MFFLFSDSLEKENGCLRLRINQEFEERQRLEKERSVSHIIGHFSNEFFQRSTVLQK